MYYTKITCSHLIGSSYTKKGKKKINLPPLLCIWEEIQHYFVVLWPLLLIPGADGDFTQSLSPCVCQDNS